VDSNTLLLYAISCAQKQEYISHQHSNGAFIHFYYFLLQGGGVMIDRQFTLSTLNDHERSMLVELSLAQHMRLSQLDPRLYAVRSREQSEAMLQREGQRESALYAVCDVHGRLRGYVQPALWRIHERSILLAFLTARNGVAQGLTLPSPEEHDALVIADMLLHRLNDYWQQHATTGDLIQWPSHDTWLEPVLKRHGFLLDSVCALHPLPSTISSGNASAPLITRHARPTDEATLLELFREELQAHEPYTPFVHITPGVLQAFQAKLARLWRGTSLENGAPLILVVECDGEVVAMAECTLLEIQPDDEPGYTPPGRYGCIDNISVHAAMRGLGVGRLLVQAVYAAFAAKHQELDGYMLWYNPDNLPARAFWSRLGYAPLWTTYQRSNN
jgi:GNAT superfamily N-acetyltransferase